MQGGSAERYAGTEFGESHLVEKHCIEVVCVRDQVQVGHLIWRDALSAQSAPHRHRHTTAAAAAAALHSIPDRLLVVHGHTACLLIVHLYTPRADCLNTRW